MTSDPKTTRFNRKENVKMMMRIVTLLAALLLICGCGTKIEQIGAASQFTGKLTGPDGAAVGNVLLTLQPLEAGHPVLMEVDAKGEFKGEGIPGEYAYFVGKSSKGGASGDATLKKLPQAALEANMTRKVKLGESPQVEIKL
jgi:hypothetical protein